MTKIKISPIRVGILVTGMLAFGLTAAEYSKQRAVSPKAIAAVPKGFSPKGNSVFKAAQEPVAESIAIPVGTVSLPPPLAADATLIPDEYLVKLSNAVGVDEVWDKEPDQTRWARATPVAEKLLQGPCDCEQRNWLKHFVEMGESVVSGDDTAYYRLARVMSQLSRNDNQAMAANRPVK